MAGATVHRLAIDIFDILYSIPLLYYGIYKYRSRPSKYHLGVIAVMVILQVQAIMKPVPLAYPETTKSVDSFGAITVAVSHSLWVFLALYRFEAFSKLAKWVKYFPLI